jgi:N-acetylglucosamine-6-phosphate deacetylase
MTFTALGLCATFPLLYLSLMRYFTNGTIVLADSLHRGGSVGIEGDRVRSVSTDRPPDDADVVDLQGGYLTPGFIDLHVHGGDGSDFMDGTPDAFVAVCRAHARHGTTSLAPTSTVARHDQQVRFLELCRRFMSASTGGARVLGAHLYGPYFNRDARGCHSAADVRPPMPADYEAFLAFADAIRTATVAPELPGAEAFVRACRAKGIRCNAGHSYATFEQMEAALGWGVRHVDHLFCAMSDRARLRQSQTYPMRGGVLEATLFFDELTTEVIADGKHLNPELLRLAYKLKGPDRLTLVTDANRALDMPDGEYWFGPADGGERIVRRDDVGLMLDGKALASGVVGLDHGVRTFLQAVPAASLVEVIRMATLTPARILGLDGEIGSIAPGKRADLVVLDAGLNVQCVFVAGEMVE